MRLALRKLNRPLVLILMAMCAVFMVFVWIYETAALQSKQEEVFQYGRFLEIPLWNLDQKSGSENILLIYRSGEYRSIAVFHPDGEKFASVKRGFDEGPLDRLLTSLNLIRDYAITQPIVYKGQTIGRIEAICVNSNFYVYIYALFSLLLLAKISQYYYNLAHSRGELETANRELIQQMAERRKVEEQLRHAQKMEAVGQLSAGVAHNFNNMLAIIMGYLELMLRAAPQNLQADLSEAINATQRAADVVDQLMLFARRPLASEFEPINLQELIKRTEEICRKTFDRKFELVVEVPADLAAIQGDENQLQQVFLDLCLNARDAFEDLDRPFHRIQIVADTLKFEAGDLPAHPQLPPGSYARVQIRDNGSGMDRETRERVFEPFFTTKEIGEGTGLGLATVYGILQEHNGWIDCQSELGVGTTFLVHLPAAGPALEHKETAAENIRTARPATILVVEDEQSIRQMITRMLETDGYTVLQAADGQEGLEVFQRERDGIDLILLDLSMPELSGQETLSALRALDANIGVVLFTGYSVGETDFEGVRAVLRKPVRRQQLLQTVIKALDTQ
jgi:signal transduction histidine kinase